jgi:hypothetical protein
MSRATHVAACVLFACAVSVGMLAAARPAVADGPASHCPVKAGPDAAAPEIAGCYYPEVTVSATPSTVTVGTGTSTITYTIVGANPNIACWKSGGNWSGDIPVDASGYASGQGVVGPFGSTGTRNFGVTCAADPANGYGEAVVTIVPAGPPPPPPPPPGGSCSEQGTSQLWSEFVGMSALPSPVDQGRTFSVSISFKNAGQCTWTAANGYKLGSQSPENNTNWGANRILLGSGEAIGPGQTKTFNFTAQAPSNAGSYGFQWRMVREGINWFGPSTPNATVLVDSSISQNALQDAYGSGPSGTDEFVAYRQGGNVFCRTIKPWVSWSQVFTGLRFWTYRQDITWCWNNSRITSVSRNRYADKNNFPGNPWSFEGHQSTNCNTENCSDKAFGTAQTITTQGKFQACAFVVVFCSTKHPYIEVVVNRGGAFTLVRATP